LKLLSFSDLHLDHSCKELNRDITREVATYIREVAPDRVIVAGDMAGGAENCIRYIEEIEQLTGIPLSYVPGNHSIWTLNKQEDASWREYERLQAHHSSLIDRPLHLNDEWVLIGDMGWYDYSFKEPHRTREEIVRERNQVWKDSVLARWGMSDEELCQKMLDKFERQLNAAQDKKVIFVNHFIPYRDYVPVSQHWQVWNMIRPFMGTAQLGELLDRYENVRYVIFGHIHRRMGTMEKNGKMVICNPLGYIKEWGTPDFMTEIRQSGTIIDLTNT